MRIVFPNTNLDAEDDASAAGRAIVRAQQLFHSWRKANPAAFPQTEVELHILQATPRTQVIRAHLPNHTQILKFHSCSDTFFRERFALKLLEKSEKLAGLAPHCDLVDEDELVLLLEYVEEAVKIRTNQEFEEACHFLGRVHRRLQSYQDVLCELLKFPTAEALMSSSAFTDSGSKKPALLTEAWKLLLDAFGEKIVPCHVGDLKPGHLRRRKNGDLCLIDLESLSWFPQTIDLLCMLNLVTERAWQCPFDEGSWLRGCAYYFEGAQVTGDSGKLLEAVRLTARAFALQEMVPST